MNERFNILVIDDEDVMRDSCLQILSRKGYEVFLAENGRKGLEMLANQEFDIVILDMKLPDIDGFEILKIIHNNYPKMIVIIITAYPTVEYAVKVMKIGAYDYIPKPFTPNVLRTTVAKALEKGRIEAGRAVCRHELPHLQGSDAIIGVSPVISELKKFIEKAGMADCSVLVIGETGTGKELAARALHYSSPRRNNNFITVDSGGLADTLIESELFGHVKGSFTGAYTDRVGRFEMANKGTLFFDEISNMSYLVQSKLLRVIQEQEFSRVGSSLTLKINVRIIAATNLDLTSEIKKGNFREDLYYRLNVISIHLPPLRDRKMDIPVLADYFLSRFRERKNKEFPEKVSCKALNAMLHYDWPGNVRELENVMERSAALCDEREVNPFETLNGFMPNVKVEKSFSDTLTKLGDIEREHIKKVIERCDFNKSLAAKILGIDRKTLRKKLTEYGMLDYLQ